MQFIRLTLRLRLFFLALLIMSDALSVTAAMDNKDKLHLRTSPADYLALNLKKEIAPWEDGKRLEISTPESFEWWYFDAILENKAIVVVYFGDNWPYGSHKKSVVIEVTAPGQKTQKFMKVYDSTINASVSESTSSANVKFGGSSFVGDLNHYRIKVDPSETGGLGCDLTLDRVSPSFRPGTGFFLAGKKSFGWLAAVPSGHVVGTLTVNGSLRPVSGSGYHDHNWGNASPADVFKTWWWGRGFAGEHVAIATNVIGVEAVGGTQIPILYLAKSERVEVDAHLNDVSFSEGPLIQHPDPKHHHQINKFVLFSVKGGAQVKFPISDFILASSPLPADASARGGSGLEPWYSRLGSPLEISFPKPPPEIGQGVIEYFELK